MSADSAGAAVLVKVPRPEAFRLFTEEIDRWWRAGLKYRVSSGASVMHLECRLDGRLFEALGQQVWETGRVTAWEPPARLVLDWRGVNFAPGEVTQVEVEFQERAGGTLVSVTHRGWSKLRGDHPVRHGQAPAPFLRHLGLWWGALLSALRERSGGA
jgi:uncharacterized protein YndB with AHSA1/START domain